MISADCEDRLPTCDRAGSSPQHIFFGTFDIESDEVNARDFVFEHITVERNDLRCESAADIECAGGNKVVVSIMFFMIESAEPEVFEDEIFFLSKGGVFRSRKLLSLLIFLLNLCRNRQRP